MTPLIIGVAGGSGSGKTTVVRAIVQGIGPDRVSVIRQYTDTVRPMHLEFVEPSKR